MKEIKLNNEGVLQLIKSEIKKEDEIALHNISLKSYFEKIEEDFFSSRYKVNENIVTCSSIAKSILQKGLAIPYNTLRCTTTFIGDKDSIKADAFNYLYREEDIERNKIYTIITTIPSFITIDNKEYFVGKITKKSSGLIEPTVSTDILFRKHLPTEFIYGYYNKNVLNHVIANDLELVINNNHISKMNKLERSNLYKSILQKENISMDLLDAIEKENFKYRSDHIHDDLCVINAIREKQKLKRIE